MNVAAAFELAKIFHAGQVDKAGEDYFSGHLTRVAEHVAPLGPEYVIVGVLHDILEDTPLTLEALEHVIGKDLAKSVNVLTRVGEGETYAEYINKVSESGDPIAIAVKNADIADHLRDVKSITPSMVKRYEAALAAINK
jgi:(p)ppGpp synthase/HD superfamily hydrolase